MNPEHNPAAILDAGSLPDLFRRRTEHSPDKVAYRFYDALNEVWVNYTWQAMRREVACWQAALQQEKLSPGDRVAIMAPNSRFWVMFDQAALGLGLITVPLYSDDRVENVEYILQQTGTRLLVVGGAPQWQRLKYRIKEIKSLKRVVSIGNLEQEGKNNRLLSMSEWLPEGEYDLQPVDIDADELATIVYTSGTTGQPKGVMLTHRNILSNAVSGQQAVPVMPGDIFLSFLPLSHMLERTVGYYLPMIAGATVAHARSIPALADDLKNIQPTVLISVPRIYERMYVKLSDRMESRSGFARKLFDLAVDTGWKRFNHQQGRGRWRATFLLWPLLRRLVADRILGALGGRVRIAISGGAALSSEISRVFVGLGVPILQGYGLTEASPVITVNRLEDNIPESIGPPLPGVETRIDEDGELLARGDNVMRGYWENETATEQTISSDGWLNTGDRARLDEYNHLYITGRLKDILVLSTGEKVPPADMELAITTDSLFDQVMIVGENRPFLSALVVLNGEKLEEFVEKRTDDYGKTTDEEIEQAIQRRINRRLHAFPGYAEIRRITLVNENWTIENGLLTPTMKIKREAVAEQYREKIEAMYRKKRQEEGERTQG